MFPLTERVQGRVIRPQLPWTGSGLPARVGTVGWAHAHDTGPFLSGLGGQELVQIIM